MIGLNVFGIRRKKEREEMTNMNSFSLEYDDEYQLTSQAPNHSYTTFPNQDSYPLSDNLSGNFQYMLAVCG
jgi:hypothetical protein